MSSCGNWQNGLNTPGKFMSVGIPWHQWHLKTCWSARVHKGDIPAWILGDPNLHTSDHWLFATFVCFVRTNCFQFSSMIKYCHVPLQYLALVWTQIAHCTWLKEIGYNEKLQNQDRNGLHLICIHVGPTKSMQGKPSYHRQAKGYEYLFWKIHATTRVVYAV